MMNKEVGSDECSADDALLHQPKHQPKLSQTSSSPCMKRKGLDISDGPPLPTKTYTRPDLQDKETDMRAEEQNREDSSGLQIADESHSSEKSFSQIMSISETYSGCRTEPSLADGCAYRTEPSLPDGCAYRLNQMRPTEEQSGSGSIPSSMAVDNGSSNGNFMGGCFLSWINKFKRKQERQKESTTNLDNELDKK